MFIYNCQLVLSINYGIMILTCLLILSRRHYLLMKILTAPGCCGFTMKLLILQEAMRLTLISRSIGNINKFFLLVLCKYLTRQLYHSFEYFPEVETVNSESYGKRCKPRTV